MYNFMQKKNSRSLSLELRRKIWSQGKNEKQKKNNKSSIQEKKQVEPKVKLKVEPEIQSNQNPQQSQGYVAINKQFKIPPLSKRISQRQLIVRMYRQKYEESLKQTDDLKCEIKQKNKQNLHWKDRATQLQMEISKYMNDARLSQQRLIHDYERILKQKQQKLLIQQSRLNDLQVYIDQADRCFKMYQKNLKIYANLIQFLKSKGKSIKQFKIEQGQSLDDQSSFLQTQTFRW